MATASEKLSNTGEFKGSREIYLTTSMPVALLLIQLFAEC